MHGGQMYNGMMASPVMTHHHPGTLPYGVTPVRFDPRKEFMHQYPIPGGALPMMMMPGHVHGHGHHPHHMHGIANGHANWNEMSSHQHQDKLNTTTTTTSTTTTPQHQHYIDSTVEAVDIGRLANAVAASLVKLGY